MRDYLFRGKRVDGYGWVEGDLIHDEAENNRPRIVIGREYSTGTFFHAQAPRVIPETVGQFTGLTDKNGKKIFEGDIVRTETYNGERYEEVVGVIIYIDEHMAFGIYNEKERQIDIIDAGYRNLEVIGNVTDNPELLGE